MVVPVLGRIDFRLRVHFNWRDPGVKRVLVLMLPVTIGLGVINVDLLINSLVGALISDSAPRAIDAAFRIYMLPAGDVQRRAGDRAVPVAQPARRAPRPARPAPARGDGHAPEHAAAGPGRGGDDRRSPTPIVELIYQHGSFGPSLDRRGLRGAVLVRVLAPVRRHQPAADADVLLAPAARGSRPRSRRPTSLVNLVVSLALYKPLGHRRPGDRHGRRQRRA